MAAMAGASGARSWLQAQHHSSWLTERRIKAATAGVFVAATLGSTVALKGSSSPPVHHDQAPAPIEHSQVR
jgi:hypothetical protein